MIRTTDQLIDKIAQELIWRRKELTDLRALVQECRSEQIRSKVLIRSAIALLYAHWEGFVKISSAYYLEYVASTRLPYRKLAANFVGLTLRSKFNELGASERISGGNALADFFCSKLDCQSNVPYKKVVETRSNLSSIVLQDIMAALGLDVSVFRARFNYIDANLVSPRNHVAHGEALSLSMDEYLDLHDKVIELIEIYRNQIENASVQKLYERVELG